MSWSCAEAPARRSTTKITASASATACSAWRAISRDDAGRVLGLEAAGVDDDELVAADLGVAVVAVARQAGEVGDDRVARPGQAVEERRLADVRPADEGDHGFHRSVARAERRRAERRSGRTEGEHAAAARDDDEHAADAHRRRRDRAAVGRHARLRLALGAREPVQRAVRIAVHDRARRPPPARRGRGTSAPPRSRRCRRWRCATRSSDPTRRRRTRARCRRRSRRCRRPSCSTRRAPACASTQPTAAWNERAQSEIAARAPAGRSGRRAARPRSRRAASRAAPPSAPSTRSDRCRPCAAPGRPRACS